MMTDWPSSSLIFGWRMRKKISLWPPGAAGFTTRTGLTGNCCAPAVVASMQQRRKAEVGRRKGSRLPALTLMFFPFDIRHSTFDFILVSSLRLDAGFAYDLYPFRDLGLVERVVLLRGVGDHLRSLFGEVFLDPGIVERLDQGTVDPVHDCALRTAGGEHCEPARYDEPFQSLFLHSGDILRGAGTLLAGLGNHAQLSGFRVWHRRRHAHELHLHVPRDEV